jgi:hypothetical protein
LKNEHFTPINSFYSEKILKSYQTFNNGALSLAEALGGVTSRAVRQKLGELLLDCYVILKIMQ